MTTATLPRDVKSISWLSGRDLDIATVDDIDPDDCPCCVEIGAVTTVRVYCRTGDDDTSWVREACFDCAPKLIGAARNEYDDRTGRIPVEIAA